MVSLFLLLCVPKSMSWLFVITTGSARIFFFWYCVSSFCTFLCCGKNFVVAQLRKGSSFVVIYYVRFFTEKECMEICSLQWTFFQLPQDLYLRWEIDNVWSQEKWGKTTTRNAKPRSRDCVSVISVCWIQREGWSQGWSAVKHMLSLGKQRQASHRMRNIEDFKEAGDQPFENHFQYTTLPLWFQLVAKPIPGTGMKNVHMCMPLFGNMLATRHMVGSPRVRAPRHPYSGWLPFVFHLRASLCFS